ncbi:Ribonuclease MRP protein subunit POP4 [Linum grandiflorum]
MAADDGRKHAMDALERRFAVAKAEVLQQQKRSEKRPRVENHKREGKASESSSSGAASVSTSVDAPTRKGNFFSSSYFTAQDMEGSGLTYSEISQPVHENLLTTNSEVQTKRGSTVDKILHDIFQHGDISQKYMQGSRTKKLESWILLDNYVPVRGKSKTSRTDALQLQAKRSKKHMSMKQHKKCGSLELPKHLRKFDVFTPMHEMWKEYISQLLKNTGKDQLAQCLLGADLHGAIIIVVDCKISSFTGVSGIMIRETAATFGIITRDDKFRAVPKKASVFIFQADCWKITLHGDKLISRNSGLQT